MILNGDEKQAICEELRDMVKMFRALKQDTGDEYIGKFIGKKLKILKLRYSHSIGGHLP